MVARTATQLRTKSSQHADSSIMLTSTSMHKATSGKTLKAELPSENLGKVVDSISELNKIKGDCRAKYDEVVKNNTKLEEERGSLVQS